jgi:DNA-directed RNA polymerase specialized sigma subunit
MQIVEYASPGLRIKKMTLHTITKHKLKIHGCLAEFYQLLDKTKLTSMERQIIEYYYVKDKNMGWIADELGYHYDTIKRKHKAALMKISQVI